MYSKGSQHDVMIKDPERYKTMMCRNMQQKGCCPYGRRCQYAHTEKELRMNDSKRNVKCISPPECKRKNLEDRSNTVPTTPHRDGKQTKEASSFVACENSQNDALLLRISDYSYFGGDFLFKYEEINLPRPPVSASATENLKFFSISHPSGEKKRDEKNVIIL